MLIRQNMNDVYLSVIVPAYNEEKNLKSNSLDDLYSYLTHQKYSFEIIFVNDGSSDRTFEGLRTFSQNKKQVQVIDNPHQGKALTVKTGMLAANGRIRLFTDFDQSTPIGEIDKLLPFIEKGYDVVIGSREVKGARREDEPLHRHLMGKVFNMVVRILAVWGIMDTQCGFKLFTDAATVNLFNRLMVTSSPKNDAFTGAFDVELLFLAQKFKYKIAEVPVIWHHIISQRVSPLKDSIRMFIEVIRIRWSSLSGKYDKPRG